MFSGDIKDLLLIVDAIGKTEPLDSRLFSALLAKSARVDLDPEEIVVLLNGTRDKANRQRVIEFAASFRRPHDREVLLLPPLYFSSICENHCAYCEFSSGGGIRLAVDEFELEFEHLVTLGFRSIELVSSQDPELYHHGPGYCLGDQSFDIGHVLPYFDIARRVLNRHGGGMLTTNIPPVDVASLKRLKERGLDCFLVWQETFDPDQYGRLHYAQGPKANQAFRLDSMENALAAGIRHIAGAFLKGLYDWRKEEAVLYLFDRHLKQLNGRGFSIIGTPRIKGRFADSPTIRPFGVSDEDYVLNIALDRVLFNGILWLQTRESFEFNWEIIRTFGAGVILTLLSSTAPGGYATPAGSHPQFPVQKQDLAESVLAMREAGIDVHVGWGCGTLDEIAWRHQ